VTYDVSISYCGNGKYTLAYERDGVDTYIQLLGWLIIISRLENHVGQDAAEAREGH
jgi:hypothetical protein